MSVTQVLKWKTKSEIWMVPRVLGNILACCLVCCPFVTLPWPSGSLPIFLVNGLLWRFNQKRVHPEDYILSCLFYIEKIQPTKYMAALMKLSC